MTTIYLRTATIPSAESTLTAAGRTERGCDEALQRMLVETFEYLEAVEQPYNRTLYAEWEAENVVFGDVVTTTLEA